MSIVHHHRALDPCHVRVRGVAVNRRQLVRLLTLERHKLKRERYLRFASKTLTTVIFIAGVLLGLALAAGVGHFREMKW